MHASRTNLTPANNTRSQSRARPANSDINEQNRESYQSRTPGRRGANRENEETLTLSVAATTTRDSPQTTRAARTLDLRAVNPAPIPAPAIDALLQAIQDLCTIIAAQPTATGDVLLDRLAQVVGTRVAAAAANRPRSRRPQYQYRLCFRITCRPIVESEHGGAHARGARRTSPQAARRLQSGRRRNAVLRDRTDRARCRTRRPRLFFCSLHPR